MKQKYHSLRDIETVKNVFKKRLATIYHSRVAYPEIHKKADSGQTNADAADSAEK